MAPLSNAERKCRYHAKLSEERCEEVKQKVKRGKERKKKILSWQRSRKKKDESKKETLQRKTNGSES